MSWRQPRRRPKVGDAMNVEVFDALQPYAEEVGGHLNEHNFDEGAFPLRTDIDSDAGITFAQNSDSFAPAFVAGARPPDDVNRRVTQARAWAPIPKTSTTTWSQTEVATTKERWHILVSFQAVEGDQVVNRIWDGGATGQMVFPKWAVRIDGVVQISDGWGGNDDSYLATTTHPAYGVVIETVVEVDPGEHIVEPVCYCFPEAAAGAAEVFPEVWNQELIILRARS